jgi:glycosyltransferase involved in cell wall biosynthesis
VTAITVLYDGWALARHPNSPAALHLLALLAYLPDEANPVIALPEARPDWLPSRAVSLVQPTGEGGWARLGWEQRTLPRLARQAGAHIIHLPGMHAPLLSPVPSAASPAEWLQDPEENVLPGRALGALGRGGLARRGVLFWPADLPDPPSPAPLVRLPPLVHPDFARPLPHSQAQLPDLPETYVLYHGPLRPTDQRRLLNAWSWAADAVGSLYPLVVLGAQPLARARLGALLGEFGLGDSVVVLPEILPQSAAAVYQGCRTLFHPAPVLPWGGAVRHALSCGKPVVVLDSPQADAQIGRAGFTLPASESRRLGAALITTIVEDEVLDTLSEAARQQAAGWVSPSIGPGLLAAYRKLVV